MAGFYRRTSDTPVIPVGELRFGERIGLSYGLGCRGRNWLEVLNLNATKAIREQAPEFHVRGRQAGRGRKVQRRYEKWNIKTEYRRKRNEEKM